jgi:hypothetical protein
MDAINHGTTKAERMDLDLDGGVRFFSSGLIKT